MARSMGAQRHGLSWREFMDLPPAQDHLYRTPAHTCEQQQALRVRCRKQSMTGFSAGRHALHRF